MTETQLATLRAVAANRFIGGYFTQDRAEYKRIVRLQRRGLIKYLSRGYPFYKSFFTVTDKGATALSGGGKEG